MNQYLFSTNIELSNLSTIPQLGAGKMAAFYAIKSSASNVEVVVRSVKLSVSVDMPDDEEYENIHGNIFLGYGDSVSTYMTADPSEIVTKLDKEKDESISLNGFYSYDGEDSEDFSFEPIRCGRVSFLKTFEYSRNNTFKTERVTINQSRSLILCTTGIFSQHEIIFSINALMYI